MTFQENIYGPLEGTPLPPGPGTRRGSRAAPAPPAGRTPLRRRAADPLRAGGTGGRPQRVRASPNPATGPSVAIATYDPQTGQFATPDGGVYRQTDLVAAAEIASWQDLLPTG